MDNGAGSYHRFLEGDENALEEIVEQYNRNLILFLNGYVSNITVAEDLAADTFLELIMKKPHFKQGSSFKTYLFAIGRNNALDYLKKRARHKTVPFEDVDLADKHLLEDDLIRGEQQKQINTAIKTLHPEYRDVLHLLYFEEMDYKETAAVLRKNIKQISNLSFRAKKALKAIIEKGEF